MSRVGTISQQVIPTHTTPQSSQLLLQRSCWDAHPKSQPEIQPIGITSQLVINYILTQNVWYAKQISQLGWTTQLELKELETLHGRRKFHEASRDEQREMFLDEFLL